MGEIRDRIEDLAYEIQVALDTGNVDHLEELIREQQALIDLWPTLKRSEPEDDDDEIGMAPVLPAIVPGEARIMIKNWLIRKLGGVERERYDLAVEMLRETYLTRTTPH